MLAADEVRRFGLTPRVALLSHSSFGSSDAPSASKMREALELILGAAPDLEVEGEMHGDAALSKRDSRPRVPGLAPDREANLLIMPNLDAANITYNVLKIVAGEGVTVGPILLGAAKPVHILTPTSTVRRIVNMTALAAVDAGRNASTSWQARLRLDAESSPAYQETLQDQRWRTQAALQVTSTSRCSSRSCSACCSAISTRRSATAMKPLGDGFIKLIKMMIAPIIFCTVVVGIAGMEDMKKVGRGRRQGAALLRGRQHDSALVIGLLVVNLCAARRRHERRSGTLDTQGDRRLRRSRPDAEHRRLPAAHHSRTPWSTPSPRARSCRCCCSPSCSASRCTGFGERGTPLFDFIDQTRRTCSSAIIGIVMKVAPIGAFGAMAFTIGKYGVGSLLLARPADARPSTSPACSSSSWCSATIARLAGFSIFKFIQYIKEELLIVLGTSSSESVLPRMMAKLENLGCASRSSGWSFRPAIRSTSTAPHLPDDGGRLHRPGDQYAADARRSS